MEKSIVLFDGVCNFCNSAVQFIIKRDRQNRYVFGPLQSEPGRKLLAEHNLPVDKLSTFILIENGKAYSKSGAALRIARHLSGLWPALYPLIALPAFIRDVLYNIIAKNRYKWFGKMNECMMPTAELRARFLGS
jgi:predicted DCC family thiol-disulfide oxidoreductase YuxK